MTSAYFALLWILVKRARFPFLRTPPGYFFAYGLIGMVASIFLSSDRWSSVYWALAYLAPFFVIWMAFEKEETLAVLTSIIRLNELVILVIVLTLLPEVIKVGTVDERFAQVFRLPFGLGEMRANGVGRFALAAIIISVCRLFSSKVKFRLLWFVPVAVGLFILAQSRSRSSLLGLAVCSVLFIFLWGINWRYLFIGPLTVYVIWLSGIKWRLRGHIENLVYLTGREITWQKGLVEIKQSPFLGWGFHADRLRLNFEHMHNSYLHAAIQSGVIGVIFFILGLVTVWMLILKSKLFLRVRSSASDEKIFLTESILLVGFLSTRSFFESTAAFYGVDLLILIPALCYVYTWIVENEPENEPAAAGNSRMNLVRKPESVEG